MRSIINLSQSYCTTQFAFIIVVFAISLSYCAVAADGKGTVYGTVFNNNSKAPLIGASITLLNEKDSSAVTGDQSDKSGKFKVEKVPSGKYIARISFIGYSTVFVPNLEINDKNKNIDLKEIYLDESSISGQEVVVTADRQEIEYSMGKKIVNVSKNPANKSGNAIDVLKTVPSVSVDIDNNIELRGSSSVRIQIDGKPTTVYGPDPKKVLEMIQAANVEKVELITTPSAKDNPEGTAGIINIILKKDREADINGLFSISAGTGDSYSSSLNLSMHTGAFNFFGGGSYWSNRSIGNFNTTIHRFSEDTSYYTKQLLDNNNKYYGGNLELGMDVDLSKATTMTLSGYYGAYQGRSNSNGAFSFLDGNLLANNAYHRLSKDSNSTPYIGASFILKSKLDTTGQEISLESYFSYNNEEEGSYNKQEQDIGFENPNAPSYMQSVDGESNNKEWNSHLNYVLPFDKWGRLEAGASFNYSRTKTDNKMFSQIATETEWTLDPKSLNNFLFEEKIVSLYSTFSGEVSKLTYSLGLRVENTHQSADFITNNDKHTHDYLSLFPSASLSYRVGEFHQIQLNYSRRIRRPWSYNLNPFIDSTNAVSINYGNPELSPEYYNSYELGVLLSFNTITITPSIFYRNGTDVISRYAENRNGVIGYTFKNIAESKDYGAELGFQGSAFKFINFSANFAYYRQETRIPNDSTANHDGYSYQVNGNLTFMFGKGVTCQFYSWYNPKRITYQGSQKSFYSVGFGANWDITDNLSTNLRISDLFNTMNFGGTYNGDGYTIDRVYEYQTRRVSLSLSYKLNQGFRKKNPPMHQQGGGNGGGGGEI